MANNVSLSHDEIEDAPDVNFISPIHWMVCGPEEHCKKIELWNI